MRIRRVTAHAFGPLVGETLELADGLTVVYGPNESAKSTWHAAIFAALCGRRRVKASPEESDFAQRHKPWDRTDWEVSAEVVLADCRRVELRHELVDRVTCYAKDLDVGADYSKEITAPKIRGEVPDASRWLGLDRRAFLATACVQQSDLLSVTERAGGIQEHLQRAAATAGADATAASALSELTKFRDTKVGTAHSRTKPLQVAELADRSARAALVKARADHVELERRTVETQELRQAAEAIRVRLHGHEAAQAHAAAARLQDEADRLLSRATEATELTALVDTPVAQHPPAAPVAAAAATWDSLPPAPSPTTPSSVDSGRVHRIRPVLAFVAALALVLVAGYLFVSGSAPMAGAALAVGLVVAAIGLFLTGRASARSMVAVTGRDVPDDERRQWDQARGRAAAQVLAAAASIGAGVDQVDVAMPLLTAWLADEPARSARRDQLVAWRFRLAELLDGGTLADIRQRADLAAELAARASDGLPVAPDEGASGDGMGLRREHEEADRHAFLAEKALAEYAAAHTSVPEAEERAQAEAAKFARVRELDRILSLTEHYLTRAQDRVHRDIAPRLAAAVRRDLAVVTAGRYTDAVVSPTTLRVDVRGPQGRLRNADRLSVGTAEQVYLLLRVALAEQLVRSGESCPLLLDDVTVHADRDRTERVLRLLLNVAQRHQVVLFTQQEQVRNWARTELDGERHAIRELAPVSTV
jgi:AAA domain